MKVDRTNLESLRSYREKLMHALEHSDYLSPVRAYQDALHKVNSEIGALEQVEAIRLHGVAHEARHIKRQKARTASDERKKKRGLDAAIARMRENPT